MESPKPNSAASSAPGSPHSGSSRRSSGHGNEGTLSRGKSCSGKWWEIELVILRLIKYIGHDFTSIMNFRGVCKAWNHFAIPLFRKLHAPIMLLGAEDGNLVQFLELMQDSPLRHHNLFPFTKFDMKILLNRERCDDDLLEFFAAFGENIEDLKISLEFGEGIIEWVDDEGLFELEDKHLNNTRNLTRLDLTIVNRIPLKELGEASGQGCQALEEGIKKFIAATITSAASLEWFKFTVNTLDLDEERDTVEEYVEDDYIHEFYWGDTIADSLPATIKQMLLRKADFHDEDWFRLPIKQSRKASAISTDSSVLPLRDGLLG